MCLSITDRTVTGPKLGSRYSSKRSFFQSASIFYIPHQTWQQQLFFLTLSSKLCSLQQEGRYHSLHKGTILKGDCYEKSELTIACAVCYFEHRICCSRCSEICHWRPLLLWLICGIYSYLEHPGLDTKNRKNTCHLLGYQNAVLPTRWL